MSHAIWEGFSHVGSGTTPWLYGERVAVPSNPDVRRLYRQGENSIIINFEDTSVRGSGITRRLNVSDSSHVRLERGYENRRAVLITNESSTVNVFLGFTPSFTTDVSDNAGYVLLARTSVSIDAQARIAIYGKTSAGSATVSVLEVS